MAFLRAEHGGVDRSASSSRPVGAAWTIDATAQLLALRFVVGRRRCSAFARDASASARSTSRRSRRAAPTLTSAEIRSSLFAAADAVGLPDAVTVALADLFAGDIDFLQDLRRGDRFSVLYEMRHHSRASRSHRAASSRPSSSTRETFRAVLWKTPTATTGTTRSTGAARKAFLRSPMDSRG